MGHANNIITAPVDVYGDIAALFGIASGDVGDLITRANINEWAKYKPVRYTSVGETGRLSGNDYWKGTDFKCGFAFTLYTEFGSPNSQTNTFAKLLYNNALDWTYARPRGTASPYSEPFRVLDFDGYNHNAMCPLGDIAATTVYLQLRDGNYYLVIDYDFNTPVTYGLNLSEISADGGVTNLASWYLGVLLYNGTKWYALTSTSALGDSGYSMSCQFPASEVGSWQCVPFISKNQITVTSSGVANGGFVSFYNKHRFAITIVIGSVNIFSSAMWEAIRSLSWEVVINNDDASQKSFTNPEIIIQRTDSPASPENGTQIGSMQLSNFTVNGGATHILSSDTLGLITPNEDYSDNFTYWVRFKCDQQGYNSPWEQVEPYDPIEH